jgi:hypothetical protein
MLNNHIGQIVAEWAKAVLQVLVGMGLFVVLVKSGIVKM